MIAHMYVEPGNHSLRLLHSLYLQLHLHPTNTAFFWWLKFFHCANHIFFSLFPVVQHLHWFHSLPAVKDTIKTWYAKVSEMLISILCISIYKWCSWGHMGDLLQLLEKIPVAYTMVSHITYTHAGQSVGGFSSVLSSLAFVICFLLHLCKRVI